MLYEIVEWRWTELLYTAHLWWRSDEADERNGVCWPAMNRTAVAHRCQMERDTATTSCFHIDDTTSCFIARRQYVSQRTGQTSSVAVNNGGVDRGTRSRRGNTKANCTTLLAGLSTINYLVYELPVYRCLLRIPDASLHVNYCSSTTSYPFFFCRQQTYLLTTYLLTYLLTKFPNYLSECSSVPAS